VRYLKYGQLACDKILEGHGAWANEVGDGALHPARAVDVDSRVS
jgi:hypothetical protein